MPTNMKAAIIIISLIVFLVLILGYIITKAGKKGEMCMHRICFKDPGQIRSDAADFLKSNSYHNLRYNQNMLEQFAQYRIQKHGNDAI